MKYKLLIILLFIEITVFAQFKIVKKVTTSYESSKNHKAIQKESFTEYNKLGQEIIFGYFGEYSSSKVVHKAKNDSSYSVTYYESSDHDKINWEDFSFYDSLNHMLTKKETWFFHNNRKDYVGYATFYFYDRKGELIKEKRLGDSNKVEKSITHYYNEKGNNVKEIDSDFSNYGINEVDVDSILYSYDGKNRIIQSLEYTKYSQQRMDYTYNNNDSNITWIFRFDNQKNDTVLKLWSISTTSYGYVFSSKDEIYPTPSDWQILEKTCRTIDGVLNERYVYVYNKDGLLDKIIDQQGLCEQYSYEYY
ncbi:MAG TPA: hypothetical protein VK809_01370 [Bacteroidia bacterium]|nr:hypothetical protein [Bacteroidia bacterium]